MGSVDADRPILVTGAAGFVGSAVTARLLALGHKVLAMDIDHNTGRLEAHPLLECVTADIRDADAVNALVDRAERVLHFAAIADVRVYSERPLDVLEVNLMGTRTVLLAAHRARIPVLFASSSEALGKNTSLLDERADTVLGPTDESRWSYAVTKIASEHWAWALAREGLTATAVRYFNVYGPTMDAPGRGRVITKFLGKLLAGEPLELVDGGHATRCFCWIDDAADATVQLALAMEPGSPTAGRPFHIGRPEPITMRELASHMIRLSGHPHGVREVTGTAFFGKGFAEIPHRVPDVSALEEAIGFRAEVPLEEGLRRVLDHWGLLADEAPAPVPPPLRAFRPIYDADRALLDSFQASLDAGWTTNNGPQTQAFEAELAAWLGVDEVVSVASGAAGLLLAAHALGGSGVAILPSFTYVATLNAVERAGYRPVFCDIEEDGYTLSVSHLDQLLATHDDVQLIVPVTAFGVIPELPAIEARARKVRARVLHDAAHAFGTSVAGHRSPGHADATVFSFHATKVMAAIEGGAVITPDPALATRLRALRTHGLGPDPLQSETGWNAKIDELSAATGRHTLARLDAILARRRGYDAELRAGIAKLDAYTPQWIPPGMLTNVQNTVVRSTVPVDQVLAVLAKHGIQGRRYFSPPLHHLARVDSPPLPVTEAVHASLVCLPLYSRMAPGDIDRIVAALAEAAR